MAPLSSTVARFRGLREAKWQPPIFNETAVFWAEQLNSMGGHVLPGKWQRAAKRLKQDPPPLSAGTKLGEYAIALWAAQRGDMEMLRSLLMSNDPVRQKGAALVLNDIKSRPEAYEAS